MATPDNAELLALLGLLSAYQGKLGVVEEDAAADLLLVDGNPLTDTKHSLLLMKDGRVYKNLPPIREQPQSEVPSTPLHRQSAKEVWTGSPGCARDVVMLVRILPWEYAKIAFEQYITTRAPWLPLTI